MGKEAEIPMPSIDYYEFLQISPHADYETIHRVYRFLATRFHPDNPKSGSAAKFHELKTAYDILSDPDRRAEYDAEREKETVEPVPLSNSIDFMDNLDGELNRRLGVLAVLYYRRRENPHAPAVPLAEIETRMGFPRDYLDFTTWYLEKKGYIQRADNSDFTLTVGGVDFVESQRANLPILSKLLTNGAEAAVAEAACQTGSASTAEAVASQTLEDHASAGEQRPAERERRKTRKERRVGAPDKRTNSIERRVNQADRRTDEAVHDEQQPHQIVAESDLCLMQDEERAA